MRRSNSLIALCVSVLPLPLDATETRHNPLPVDFAFAVFPGYSNIDIFAPVDALGLLSLRNHMNLYFVAETLDTVTSSPSSAAMNKFNSSFGSTIIPTHTFDDPPNIDVLIVPGGLGTRAPDTTLAPLINFLRDTYPKVKHLITICTGGGLVARAGILDGKAATTNKLSWNSTIIHSNLTNWKAPARFWVDENIWSTSGESAGLDGVLAWARHVWGDETAQWVANGMEHHALEWWQDEFSAIDNVTRTYPCDEAPQGFDAPPRCR